MAGNAALGLVCALAACGFSAELAPDAGGTTPPCPYPVMVTGSTSRYLLAADSLAWRFAEASCEAQGAHLFVPDTPMELAMIRALVPDRRWIGIAQPPSQAMPATGWVAVTGGAAAIVWATGKPDDGGGGEDNAEQAVALDASGLDDDAHRTEMRYICECDGQGAVSAIVAALPL